jgi:beta-lactamase class A
MTPALDALRPEIEALTGSGGTVSIWAGPIDGGAAYALNEDARHYAASTMKVAVMVAAFRAAERDEIDLGAEVDIVNRFTSALPGAPAYSIDVNDDNDDAVTDRLGGRADLGWLIERMIVRSSNLATNLLIEALGGTAGANEVWRMVGATRSVTGRGIEDAAAREAGVNNLVTAADLAALFSAIARTSRPRRVAMRCCGSCWRRSTAKISPRACRRARRSPRRTAG